MNRVVKACALLAASIALQAGCSNESGRQGVSDDLAGLRAIVRLPDAARSARWGMFGTPEYHGGVPGPTDYLTLVAELDVVATPEPLTQAKPGQVAYVVPEAARPWLSREFAALLAGKTNAAFPLTANNGCHPYTSTITKSGRPVGGFICMNGGRALLYLDMWSTPK